MILLFHEQPNSIQRFEKWMGRSQHDILTDLWEVCEQEHLEAEQSSVSLYVQFYSLECPHKSHAVSCFVACRFLPQMGEILVYHDPMLNHQPKSGIQLLGVTIMWSSSGL